MSRGLCRFLSDGIFKLNLNHIDMADTNNSTPPGAKRVFKSGYTEIWEWEQELYDGSTRTFQKIKRPDTVEAIAVVGDKIVIEDQEQSGYPVSFISVPGGMADNGDDHLTEAKRELLEETGYTSDDWKPWFSVTPSKRHIYSVHYFVARNCWYVQAPDPDPGEKISVRLVSFDEFLALSDDERFRGAELVNKLLRMRLHPEEREAFRKLLFPR